MGMQCLYKDEELPWYPGIDVEQEFEVHTNIYFKNFICIVLVCCNGSAEPLRLWHLGTDTWESMLSKSLRYIQTIFFRLQICTVYACQLGFGMCMWVCRAFSVVTPEDGYPGIDVEREFEVHTNMYVQCFYLYANM